MCSVTNPRGEVKTNDRIISFQCDNTKDTPAAALAGRVRVEFSSVDEWFEEDLPIHVHPKDPFKRIELLPSTRKIKHTIAHPKDASKEITLAEVPSSIHLHETFLPTRYYFPLTALDPGMVRKSEKSTTTKCPYKGEADYLDVVLEDGTLLSDVIWVSVDGETWWVKLIANLDDSIMHLARRHRIVGSLLGWAASTTKRLIRGLTGSSRNGRRVSGRECVLLQSGLDSFPKS